MEELVVLVQQRIQTFKQILQKQVAPSAIKVIKQEQKLRCEKEAFIFSIIKSNKLSNLTLRKSFYNGSYQIMKKMAPEFELKISQNLQSCFLNDFVVLYTEFFKLFQDQFCFKTKVQNFLRPTNHNLVTDLIKYLVDFTRDYFLQLLFWKNKTSQAVKKSNITQKDQSNQAKNQQSEQLDQKQKIKKNNQNQKYLAFQPNSNLRNRKKSESINQDKKNQVPKMYDILSISPLSSLSSLSKDSTTNLQTLKIRINDMFRDQKSRNSQIRQISQQYFLNYNERFAKNTDRQLPYYETYKRTNLNRLVEPFKLLLFTQKNNFSYINVHFDPRHKLAEKQYYSNSFNNSPEKLKNIQKIQNQSLSPLKIIKRNPQQCKIDVFLISMKVLRASDNFLPPILNINTVQNATQSSQGQKLQNKINALSFSLKLKRISHDSQNRNQAQKKQYLKQKCELKKIELATSYNHRSNRLIKFKDVKRKPLKLEEVECLTRQSQKNLSKKQPTQPEINQNSPSKKKKYLQFSEQKRMFKAENAKSSKEQQKILEWLQKIKNLKQMERRKILGLNY